MNYSLSILATITDGIVKGDAEKVISHIITDSRYLAFASDSLFVALRGQQYDGHHFIAELSESGVQAFLVEETPVNPPSGISFLVVKSTRKALQQIAAYHRSMFSYPVIGITGSYGKSIIKEWLFDMMSAHFNIVRSPKSYNSQIGVPLSVLQMNEHYNLALFEAGISQPGEMQNLETIIKPAIGIFTNIGNAHQENFTNLEQKIDEKLNLFKDTGTIILPSKYPLLINGLKNKFPHKQTLTWGKEDSDNLKIIGSKTNADKTVITFSYQSQTNEITLPFTHEAFIENALAVVLTALFMGIDFQHIKKTALKLRPIEMRLELVEAIDDCTLINDYYNSDLTSVSVALQFLQQQNNHPGKAIILSDIPHTGYSADEVYKTVAQWIKNDNINLFIGIGKEIVHYKEYFPKNAYYFNDVELLMSQLSHISFRGTTLLLKGARAFKFEKISYKIQMQAHETVLNIDLNALLHNFNVYKSNLPQGTKIMAMVKAFSYGSGIFEVAKLLQHHHVDYLAVAFADEGYELRTNGIHVPIMVMGPETSIFDSMLEYHLEPVIYNFRTLRMYANAANKAGYASAPLHIKLDTGMHRLGFMPEDIDKLLHELEKFPCLIVSSVFSHLAASEDAQEDEFTRSQLETLKSFTDKLKQKLSYSFLIHALNSGGIERFPQYAFDMVRLGIGMYGISNGNVLKDKMQNVLSLKTTVSQVKWIHEGETIGYNRRGKLPYKAKIAILPIGYADGIDRKLSNGAFSVKINGKKAPVVGTICMDMCMVDVTGIDVQEGDEVIIFDSIEDILHIADVLKTIPYEIFTGISRRVKRIYYHD